MPAPNNLPTSFNLLKNRLKRLEPLFSVAMGTQLTTAVFEHLVDKLARGMGLREGQQILAVRNIMAPYYGYELTQLIRQEILWRLGAGWDRIEAGLPLASSFEQRIETYWAGLIIEDISNGSPTKSGKPCYTLTFRITDGYFAGLSFSDTIPSKWVRFKFAREIGFARFKPLNISELVGCCVVGGLDLADPLRPRLDDFDAKQYCCISRNQALRSVRRGPCHVGYECACHDCPVGHTMCQPGQFTCYRATHRASYITKLCPRCNLVQEYDPLSSVPVCLLCQLREQSRREQVAQIGS